MVLEFSPLAGVLLKAVLPKVAASIAQAINHKLNPNDLQRALKAGLESSQALKMDQQMPVFYRCDDKARDTFLAKFLEHSGTLGELQKPLNQAGNPNIEHLVHVAKQVAEAHKIPIQENYLKPWLVLFVHGYFAKTDMFLQFQSAKQDYFGQLANWFDDVKFAGVAVESQEIENSEKLAQIFVMPDVKEDVRTIEQSAKKLADLLEKGAIQPNRQTELLQDQRQRALLNSPSQKFSAQKLLSQNKVQIVLLGAPGSGKTTLMSYFAVMLAQQQKEKVGLPVDLDWLPILIRIRDWERYSTLSIPEYACQFAEKTLSVKTLPKGFFEYWLETGQALILLDGLDEVADESRRYDLVRRIENFLGQYRHNFALITSRPAGYKRDFFRTEEFPHYELQPFDDSKITEFISRWYNKRFPDPPEAKRRKDGLHKALNESDRIKLLARNPLLLTIIALIHRYQAVLPRERHKLYDKAVETLLTSWDANKELSNQTVLKHLQLDDLRRLMESLAYWIHCHPEGKTGDREGGTLIDRDELIEQLGKDIKTLKQIELHEAKAEAKRFVNFIRDRTGLLNEQGHNCYAFVHKTFQEYLCAQEINYQADNESNFNIILNHLRDYLHNQHWREVLLLLVTQQKPKPAVKAIRAIYECKSDYENWLHRNLLFAGSCLAENPKNLKGVDDNLLQEILTNLVDLAVRNSAQVGSEVHSRIEKIIYRLHETDFEIQTLQLLKERISLIGFYRLQQYRAILGETGAAVSALVQCLQDQDATVRSSAARALGELGNASAEVVSVLVQCLQDQDSTVRYRAALALGELGNASAEVVSALVQISQDEKLILRITAINALGKLRCPPSEVVSALLQNLPDENPVIHVFAVQALSELSNVSKEAVQALLQYIQAERSNLVPIIFNTVSRLGILSAEVVSALVQRLQDQDATVRFSAARALGELGNASAEVVSALVQRLQDQDATVRFSATRALGRLGNASAEVVSALVQCLQDQDATVLSSAALALGELGNASAEVVSALVQCLQDQDATVRINATWALGKLGNASAEVVSALVQYLRDQDATVLSSAALALGELGNASAEVVSALIQCLQSQEVSVASKAALALGELGNASAEVISALIQCLQSQEVSVASKAALALDKLSTTSAEVVSALIQCLQSQEVTVAPTAALALDNLGKQTHQTLTVIIRWLEKHQDSEYAGTLINVLYKTVEE